MEDLKNAAGEHSMPEQKLDFILKFHNTTMLLTYILLLSLQNHC